MNLAELLDNFASDNYRHFVTRSCLRKRKYHNIKEAQAAQLEALQVRSTVVKIYVCSFCGAHHLTSQK